MTAVFRFRLSALIGLVVLVALDFGIVIEANRDPGHLGEFGRLLVLSVLPAANLLALERMFRPDPCPPGRRSFGSSAVAALLIWAAICAGFDAPIMNAVRFALRVLLGGRRSGPWPFLVGVPLLTLPPVALAFLIDAIQAKRRPAEGTSDA